MQENDIQSRTHTAKKRPRGINLPTDISDDLLVREWTLSAEDKAQVRQCRGDANRVRFAIQLCVLRKYGRFLENYSSISARILNYHCRQLDIPPLLSLDEPERDATEYGHQQKIRAYLQYAQFDERIEAELIAWLTDRAVEGALAQELFQKAERVLKSWHVILPAPARIERLVASVLAQAKEEFFEKIAGQVSSKLRKRFDELLATSASGKSDLFRLKEYPPAPNAKQMLSYISRFQWLDAMLGEITETGVSPAMQRHLALLAKRHDVSDLRRFVPSKKYALLFCFAVETRKTILDHLVDMHDKYMTDLLRKYKNKHEAKLKQSRKRAQSGLAVVLDASDIVLDNTIDKKSRVDEVFTRVGERPYRDSVEDCREYLRVQDNGFVDQLWNHYSQLARYLPSFLGLKFEASIGSQPLLDAVQLYRNVCAGVSDFPVTPPTFFLKAEWIYPSRKPDGSFDRRIWDIGLAVAVRDA
ncbi:MAG: DUF4158 domain-containing protein [Candidatus Melainabacteria bacterium]|nr:DUF4158 domain-containing protein [Candidatus Melainabacteria bacterium]